MFLTWSEAPSFDPKKCSLVGQGLQKSNGIVAIGEAEILPARAAGSHDTEDVEPNQRPEKRTRDFQIYVLFSECFIGCVGCNSNFK